MKNDTVKVEWKRIFENKPEDEKLKKITTLIKKSIDAWHKSIESYFSHSIKDCWDPYKWGERTTSGVFASAITKNIKNSGSVLMEFSTYKKEAD